MTTNQKALPATSIFIDHAGVLICGPSGSGKSTLALNLIEKVATLISDDVTLLTARDGVLYADPFPKMKGCIELRNIGILAKQPYFENKPVRCIINLTRDPVERLPQPKYQEILGVKVRQFDLNPDDPALILKSLKAVDVAVGREKLLSDLNVIQQKSIQNGLEK